MKTPLTFSPRVSPIKDPQDSEGTLTKTPRVISKTPNREFSWAQTLNCSPNPPPITLIACPFTYLGDVETKLLCPSTRWSEDPFLGDIIHQDGQDFIFGRGAIDDKHSVVGFLPERKLEAVTVASRWEFFRPWRLSCPTEGNQRGPCMWLLDTTKRFILDPYSLALSARSRFCTGERFRRCWACLCRAGKDVAAKRRAVGLPPRRGDVCYAGKSYTFFADNLLCYAGGGARNKRPSNIHR